MRVEALDVSFYEVPLEKPHADGTLTWDRIGVVTVEVTAGDARSLGFTYGPRACMTLIVDTLSQKVLGRDIMDVPAVWDAMVRSIRNFGRPGIASMAIAAVDVALWDLKARVAGSSLGSLFGQANVEIPVYWSGGFTSYSDDELAAEFADAVHGRGIPRVKMKVASDSGRRPERDAERVELARKVIGERAELYVDANGAYTRKQAIRMARTFRDAGVTWFEEPVSSDDLVGLREVRTAIDVDVAAGEYGYELTYFERMADAVDVLQVDASRCGGFSEWLRAAAIAAAHGLEVSAHTAQSLHVHVAGAAPNLRHIEYFVDHARADRLLFDGVVDLNAGALRPDPSRSGIGLDVKHPDVDAYLVDAATLQLDESSPP